MERERERDRETEKCASQSPLTNQHAPTRAAQDLSKLMISERTKDYLNGILEDANSQDITADVSFFPLPKKAYMWSHVLILHR